MVKDVSITVTHSQTGEIIISSRKEIPDSKRLVSFVSLYTKILSKYFVEGKNVSLQITINDIIQPFDLPF